MQCIKPDPRTIFNIKHRSIKASQFHDRWHCLVEWGEHLDGRHRVLQHLSSNVLAGCHSGSHGGGKYHGGKVSSSLVIDLVKGKIESIIGLALCIIDHSWGEWQLKRLQHSGWE